MRNTLAFLGAAIVVFLGLGWYLGWYDVLLQPSGPGHSKLEVDINKEKIGQDVKKGSEKVQDFLDKNKQAPSSSTETKSSTSLLPPPPGNDVSGIKPVSNTEVKPSERSKELGGFIFDGWLGGSKK